MHVFIETQPDYTPDRFEKLPKWAQEAFKSCSRRFDSLEAKIETLEQKTPDSDTIVHSYGHSFDVPVKADNVTFLLGGATSDGNDGSTTRQDAISVSHTVGNKSLRVSGDDIVIIPGARNCFEITLPSLLED